MGNIINWVHWAKLRRIFISVNESDGTRDKSLLLPHQAIPMPTLRRGMETTERPGHGEFLILF